jgi:predicted regulator of Ras-like GTPase activity (Roadblock/LC7/MglB family)
VSGELTLSFVEVASAWPEGVRRELSILPGDTRLAIPASAVAPGLQKGKVCFPWSQIRAWIRPLFKEVVSVPEEFELVIPLKIVAPAFVAAMGATRNRETIAAQAIPDVFGQVAAKSAPAEPTQPQDSAAATSAVCGTEAPATGLKLSMPVETAAPEEVPTSVAVAPAPVASDRTAASPTGLTLSIASAETETPAPAAGATPCASREPATLDELLGKPAASTSAPAELIAQACELSGVTGAVVALGEGLVVAQKLPEGLAADTFAAFMPQFFERVDRYSDEMKLGLVDEITVHSKIGPCHLARTGKVFLAVLGRPGGKLPAGLKLIAAELARQNQ